MSTVRDVKRDLVTIVSILNNYNQKLNNLISAISGCSSDLDVRSIIYPAEDLNNYNKSNAGYIDRTISDINGSLEILLKDYVVSLRSFRESLKTIDVSGLIGDCEWIYENALISAGMEGFWKYTPTHEDLLSDVPEYRSIQTSIPNLIERASYWNSQIIIKNHQGDNMERKRLKDYTLTIFTDIATEIPDIKLFTYVSASYLDMFLNHFYSERIASSMLDNVTATTLASIIAYMYKDKWNTLIDYSVFAYNAVANGGTKTETLEQTDTKGTETVTTGLVSPYNEDDFSNRDKNTVANSGADKTEYVKTTIDTGSYILNLQKFREYLNDSNIYDTIMADVLNVIALKIY